MHHRRPNHHRRHVAKHVDPVRTIPRGLPPRLDDRPFGAPVRLIDQTEPVAAVSAPASGSSGAGVFLLVAAALGLLLLVASLLPVQALRPAAVYHAVAFHRMNLGLVGGSIVLLVLILKLAAG